MALKTAPLQHPIRPHNPPKQRIYTQRNILKLKYKQPVENFDENLFCKIVGNCGELCTFESIFIISDK